MKTLYGKLPASGPEREALREKGQFWTPDWVAEAMVGYAIAGNSDTLFDPAVGAGAFFRAAKKVSLDLNRSIQLFGSEIDPLALQQAYTNGLDAHDLAGVQLTHFVHHPPETLFSSIVANPPYLRHHRLSLEEKAKLKALALASMGFALDGRAGLHVYFLLRALLLLRVGGRLSFIVPADTCEGVFAPKFWKWITSTYCLKAVVTFAPKASPFPKVDTNPLILLIQNTPPEKQFLWARCTQPNTTTLKHWMLSDLQNTPNSDVEIHHRELCEGLATGLSRFPSLQKLTDMPTLSDFASVRRGIATGSNEFFFLTSQQVAERDIPQEFLRFAIGRTRDISDHQITRQTLRELDQRQRPTFLFCPDGRPLEDFPVSVQNYLKQGEKIGLQKKPLLSTRRPWYKMEKRTAPPFLFAYLGRRNTRFIRNEAGVLPLTVFLCVYPHQDHPDFVEKLWHILQSPQTLENIRLVGKSYGDGALKVEPRALERLPLPAMLVDETFGTLTTFREQIPFRI